MKRILLVTNIYPLLDDKYEGTKVCHFFASEWTKMGYDVKVIRLSTYFPRIAYWFARVFKERIKAKTGAVVYAKRMAEFQKYDIDNVNVLHAPIFKFYPHIVPSERRLQKILKRVVRELENDSFIPDIITGHFENPQLKAIHLLRQIYPNAKTCMVMHNGGANLSMLYKAELSTYMESIDVWGYRSYAFQKCFEELYGKQENSFICYSGIPQSYLTQGPKQFSDSLNKFVFLGSLFELKRVNDTIHALAEVFQGEKFEFNVIGDGAEMQNLKQLAKSLKIENNVNFIGRKSRDESQQIVSKSDIFVMVSEQEAFGLVYVEAMAKGCIAIGTKGQGIDGIIKHGENGFLCESKNPKALAELIAYIRSLHLDELQRISNNAIMTAASMTDENAAKNYINSIA